MHYNNDDDVLEYEVKVQETIEHSRINTHNDQKPF
jgi:hypothetical protein